MAAYKPTRGTYEIDRIFPAIGRVRLRTGTHDKRVAERYEAMLEALPLETVRLIVDGKIELRVAYDAWASGRASSLPSADTLRQLLATMQGWVEKPLQAVGAAETRSRRRVVKYFTAIAGDFAQVGDLPALVKTMRHEYAERGAAFNRARAVCMAFLRDVFGKRHQLYVAVAEIPVLDEPSKLARHPCTIAEARAIARKLAEPWGAVWWAMCCTGMGPKEYWSDGWKIVSPGIEILGQKRPARNRVVPLIVQPPAAPMTADGYTVAVKRAQLGVAPYDARRSYARWLEEVGIPGYRRDAYMGHGPKGMRQLYAWGDIKSWLVEDGEKLRRYAGEQRNALRVAQ